MNVNLSSPHRDTRAPSPSQSLDFTFFKVFSASKELFMIWCFILIWNLPVWLVSHPLKSRFVSYSSHFSLQIAVEFGEVFTVFETVIGSVISEYWAWSRTGLWAVVPNGVNGGPMLTTASNSDRGQVLCDSPFSSVWNCSIQFIRIDSWVLISLIWVLAADRRNIPLKWTTARRTFVLGQKLTLWVLCSIPQHASLQFFTISGAANCLELHGGPACLLWSCLTLFFSYLT